MKYYIIAGEASGDLHASNLMRGLFSKDPSCDIRFWGGDAMSAVGGTRVRHYRDMAVMGLVEVASMLRKILGNMSFCSRDILGWKPDAVILVDYPSFNMRIARFAKAHGFKVFWFIAPKVWAHKAWRVRPLKKYVDALYCIFPFELGWFRSHGIEPRYFGNPLPEAISRAGIRPLEGGEGVRRIALLPGSRNSELKFLMPRLARLGNMLAADTKFSGYRLTIAGAPSMDETAYRKYLPEGSRIEIVSGRTYDVLGSSEAAVICSGTASLEAALIGTPQVVCYGFNAFTWWVVSHTVRVRFVSLANLILDRSIFAELLQDYASPERISAELERILFDADVRKRMQADYQELKDKLGGTGASERIAGDIYEEVTRL